MNQINPLSWVMFIRACMGKCFTMENEVVPPCVSALSFIWCLMNKTLNFPLKTADRCVLLLFTTGCSQTRPGSNTKSNTFKYLYCICCFPSKTEPMKLSQKLQTKKSSTTQIQIYVFDPGLSQTSVYGTSSLRDS